MTAQSAADSAPIDRIDNRVGGADNAADRAWSQYVTFTIDRSLYGVEITKVREIKGWSEPTELPNGPHAMRGVLDLRGVVVPVFDLRCQFGQGLTEVGESHVVIIVVLADRLIGILVDAVSDILTLELSDILPVPEVGTSVDQRFLAGLVSRDDRMVALLRFEDLFDLDDGPSSFAT